MTKESILRAFMQTIWNNKEINKVPEFVHSFYKIHLDTADPWEGKTLSHTDFIERLQYSFQSFPDIHFEITSTIPDENHVAITWIMTGTNDGKIGDFPPTHKSIKTNGMTIYYFNGDLICGHSQIFDRQIVAKQLGFL